MTTTVTIKTHDWPVSVVALDHCADGSISTTRMGDVPPHSEGNHHYITQSRQLLVTEMKAPPKPALGADEPATGTR